MASAKGRVLTGISGSLENAAEHWGFIRNGKQHIACRRSKLKHTLSDAQKIQCVKFANSVRIANKVNEFFKIPFIFKSLSEWPTYELDPNLVKYNTWKNMFWECPGNWIDSNGNDVGGVSYKKLYDGFKNQEKDEQGSVEIPTFNGYLIKKLVPLMTDSLKNKMSEYFGVAVFPETIEGYEELKASTAGDWLLPLETSEP